MRNNTDHGHFFEVGVAAALEFRALVRMPLHYIPNSEPLLLLMMEGKSRADVATLPRRDVETSRRCDVATLPRRDVATSRRCCLLTVVLVDPTLRSWDVMTWGRRNSGTSRRCSHFHALLSLLQFASKVCSFQFICTCIHRISHIHISSWTNTYLILK